MSENSSEYRNVIITGASLGIGNAIAQAFAAEGANLFLCARNEVQLYNAVAELQLKFPQCTVQAKKCDVAKKNEVIDFADWILQKTNQINVLINNAGYYLPGGVVDEPEENLDNMLHTNLYSAYHLTRKLLPTMIAAKKGHIFNMCSIASLQAYANGGSYSISKFALAGFSKNLREELKPHQIKVTTVYPGAVFTNSWGDFDNSSNRIMEANDIATMVVAASKLSPQAVVEEITVRPQLGDL
jgi:short-subunit dehydrogenase